MILICSGLFFSCIQNVGGTKNISLDNLSDKIFIDSSTNLVSDIGIKVGVSNVLVQNEDYTRYKVESFKSFIYVFLLNLIAVHNLKFLN